MKEKLNVGCGERILNGFVNLDKFKLEGVDVVHDIEKFPWPFQDNSFVEIDCNMILEHISDLVKTMKEIYRISKDNVIVRIKVPYFSCPSNFIDPTHKKLFTYYSFDFLDNKSEYFMFMFDESLPKFKIVKRRIIFYSFMKIFEPIFNLKSLVKFYTGVLSYILPAGELYFELRAIK